MLKSRENGLKPVFLDGSKAGLIKCLKTILTFFFQVGATHPAFEQPADENSVDSFLKN